MPILAALFYIIRTVIELTITVVVINAIISWLIAFDVLNIRNQTVYRIVSFLNAVTEPLLRPIRRFIPNLGGIDISPIILIILLNALLILIRGLMEPAMSPF